jgi:hypothetical protein
MARSAVKGAASLRRLLRRLPDASREELAIEFNAIGSRLLGRARAETPSRLGRLRAALDFKVLPKTLILRLGLITPKIRKRYFYGYILDKGRRARTVQVQRKNKNGSVSSYALRVRGIDRERYNFVFGRRADLLENELPKLREVLNRVLRRASAGAGDD